MLYKIKLFIIGHKIVTGIIVIILILIGHWGYEKITNTTADTRYVTAPVTTGNIIVSVSGSGQVSASNQLNIQPKVSGNITYIGVQNGQKVTTGTLIATIDSTDAQKAVRNAQIDLDTANLNLKQTQNQNSTETLNSDSEKIYDNAYGSLSDVFLDLPSTIDGIQNILNGKDLSNNTIISFGNTARNYRATTENAFYITQNAFQKNRTDFQSLSYYSAPGDIEKVVNETYTTEKLVADTLTDFKVFLDYLSENSTDSSVYTSYQNSLASYINSTNSHISSLQSTQNNISNDKQATPNATMTLRTAQISVEQKEEALQDAKDNLSDYSIRAPFDGTIADVGVEKEDSVSGSTNIATIITNNQIAEVSLNEVDVASVKVGQKATLTFDAIPDLTIAGTVAEIDSIGTVSQGVVNYNVKINFDTQDTRVKPGMSFSAEIITNIKQNVLTVPNSAIKSQGNASYVEMFNSPLPTSTDGLAGSISTIPPTKVLVELGLSNDTNTEITSGLKEEDVIVVRTILPTTTTKTISTAPSLIGGSGISRGLTGGGGNFRGGTTGR